MITHLKLRNFKKHEKLDISFEGGVNLITGPNYAGKTTVLYAIKYALGGAAHVPGPNIQRMGTNTGLLVEMGFWVGDKRYVVERKKSSCNLYHGEELLASGTTPVNEKVEELLGMPLRRFFQLRYAEQLKAGAMMTMGTDELHKIIEEVTKADEVSKALDRLKEILSAETYLLENMPESDLEGAQAEHDEACEELARWTVDNDKALSALARADDEWEAVAPLREAAQARHREYLTASRKLKESEGEVSVLTRESERAYQRLVEAGSPNDFAFDFEGWAAEIDAEDTAQHEEAHRRRQAQHAKAEVVRLEVRLGRAEAALQAAQARRSEAFAGYVPEKRAAAKALVDQLAVEIAISAKAVDSAKFSVDQASCAECGRPFEDHDPAQAQRVLEEAQAALDTLLQRQNAAWEALEEAQRAQRVLEEAEGRFEGEALELDQAQAALRTAQAAAVDSEAREPLFDVKERRAARTKAMAAAREHQQAQKEYSRLTQALGEAQEALCRWREQVEPLKSAEADLEGLEARWQEARVSRASLQDAVQNGRRAEKAAEARVARAKDLLAREQQEAESRAKTAARVDAAKALQKFLKEGRDRYTGQVWAQFMASASDYASTLTNGEIEEILRTPEGRFVFIERGHEMHLKDASGAQSSVMGLSVQIALAESAGCPLDILLVDEPCASMDPDHSLATTALFASLGKQVVAISHSPMDSSVCSNSIRLEALA
jgi:DNA repair exonuclease SbcCD ATPase subunit